MNKLLPPKIPSTLPAFQGDEIKIPIEMNQAVGIKDFSGFCCLIKTALSNNRLGILETNIYESQGNFINVIFSNLDINGQKLLPLNPGEFYKIQIAYKDTTEAVGIFSTVGITKYCYNTSLSIKGFNDNEINSFTGQFTGVFQTDDASEKVYSYRYDIYDEQFNLLKTSGDKIHNVTEDTNNFESESYFQSNLNLKISTIYYVQYSVITTNNLQLSTPLYKVMKKQTLPSELQGILQPRADNEKGCINLYFKQLPSEDGQSQQAITGAFVITRLNTISNTWDEIFKFNLFYEVPFKLLFSDYTVEQGIEYLYAIQQYNDNGLYSDKIFAIESIKVDFEDMFLFDGKKQLRIRYNPKINSFKQIILESKINTIGSKYPFIFRNGNVGYKEFPISGLLSYKEDEAEEFVKWSQEFKENPYDVNLTAENIALERQFKLAILEWLTNGEPKLFRSPTEGNYIVRLLNVSLSPEQKLGRMIHSFSCTASEVAAYSYDSLKQMNLSGQKNNIDKKIVLWKTIPLQQIDASGHATYKTGNLLTEGQKVNSLSITDASPGDLYSLVDEMNHKVDIVIGATGTYRVDNVKISQILVPEDAKYLGLVTFSYEAVMKNKFSLIKDIFIHYYPAKQFFGKENQRIDIIKQINSFWNTKTEEQSLNFKEKLLRFYQIRFFKQNFNDDPASYDNYEIVLKYDNNITKNINIFDKKNIYVLKNIDNLSSIEIPSGVVAEVAFSTKELEFFLESEFTNIVEIKKKYISAKQHCYNIFTSWEASSEESQAAYEEYLAAKNSFLTELNIAIQQYQKDNGL